MCGRQRHRIRNAGVQPVAFLKTLYDLGFACSDLHRDQGAIWTPDQFMGKIAMIEGLPPQYGYQTDLLCHTTKPYARAFCIVYVCVCM